MSADDGDLVRQTSSDTALINGHGITRQMSCPDSLPEGAESPLPALRQFSVAKRTITHIFAGFSNCITRVQQFLDASGSGSSSLVVSSSSSSSLHSASAATPYSSSSNSSASATATPLRGMSGLRHVDHDDHDDHDDSSTSLDEMGFDSAPATAGTPYSVKTVMGKAAAATAAATATSSATAKPGTVAALAAKARKIKEAVSRDRMKVVFVGRTSGGKSTTINAMLHRRILPSGVGHTTNCFVCLVGSPGEQAFLCTDGSKEKKPVEDVKHLAHALYPDGHLASDSLVYLHWPTAWCNLLNDDVMIIDSPGLDISKDFDRWIDGYCTDADVFVLVANAESTLNETEKRFFRRVRSKLSKPNVFIEYNRWDCIDDDEQESPPELVRAQHTRNAESLLVDELGLIDSEEINQRVFFVSAREVLAHRTKPKNKVSEAVASRVQEFEQFENKFAKCISQSAIKTRFEMHVREGSKMAKELVCRVADAAHDARSRKQQTTVRLQIQEQNLHVLRQGRADVRDESKLTIKILEDTLTAQVATALLEQANQSLKRIVENFRGEPFTPSELGPYKKALAKHVEKELSELVSTCSRAEFLEAYDTAQQTIYSNFNQIVPETMALEELVPPRSFEQSFSLPEFSLSSDFKEDLEFRFSLGLSSLFGPNSSLGALIRAWLPPGLLPPEEGKPGQGSLVSADGWKELNSVWNFIQSPAGTVMITVASMLLSKSWTIKVFVCGGVGIGGLYLFERATYTTASKEAKLKDQFVAHAGNALKSVSRHVSMYSQGVGNELQQQLVAIESKVNEAEEMLGQNIDVHRENLSKLEATTLEAEMLEKEVESYYEQLQAFAQKYFGYKDHVAAK